MSLVLTNVLLDPNKGSIYRRKDTTVMDTTSTTLPLPSPSPPVVDGVTLSPGDSVLFTALTLGANIVYTLQKDTSTGGTLYVFPSLNNSSDARNANGSPSAFDVTRIEKGSKASQIVVWTGSAWEVAEVADTSETTAASETYTPTTPSNWNPVPTTIGGGLDGLSNLIMAGGGLNNSLILGGSGQNNTTGSSWSTIGGGQNNTINEADEATSSYSVLGGGQGNQVIAGAEWGVLSGGLLNSIGPGTNSTVGGGNQNSAAGHYSTISGGTTNTTSSSAAESVIGGGNGNSVLYPDGTIGGGLTNTIFVGRSSVIAGGEANVVGSLAGGDHGTVGGGFANSSLHGYSTISGGANNATMGANSTVPGGSFCVTTGDYSLTAGDHNRSQGVASLALGRGNVAAHLESIALGVGARTSGVSDLVIGNDPTSSASLSASIDAVHLRMDGTTSDLHIGRATDQASSNTTDSTVQFSISSNQTLVTVSGTAPVNGSTIQFSDGTLPPNVSDTVTISGQILTFAGGVTPLLGARLRLSSSGTLPAGIDPNTDYYVTLAAGQLCTIGTSPDEASFAFNFYSATATGTITATMYGIDPAAKYYVINSTGAGGTYNISPVQGGPAYIHYGQASDIGPHTATTLTYNNASATNKLHLHTTNVGFQSKSASLAASPNMTADMNLVLPPTAGSSGQVLSTDGSGTLNWSNQPMILDSAPSGSGTNQTLTVTGLLSTDTILAVTMMTPGTTATAIAGFGAPATDALPVNFLVDPTANAVVRVLFKR